MPAITIWVAFRLFRDNRGRLGGSHTMSEILPAPHELVL